MVQLPADFANTMAEMNAGIKQLIENMGRLNTSASTTLTSVQAVEKSNASLVEYNNAKPNTD